MHTAALERDCSDLALLGDGLGKMSETFLHGVHGGFQPCLYLAQQVLFSISCLTVWGVEPDVTHHTAWLGSTRDCGVPQHQPDESSAKKSLMSSCRQQDSSSFGMCLSISVLGLLVRQGGLRSGCGRADSSSGSEEGEAQPGAQGHGAGG